MSVLNNKTSISLHEETKARLYRARGKMELNDGKRRTLEDVINELIDHFEKSEGVP